MEHVPDVLEHVQDVLEHVPDVLEHVPNVLEHVPNVLRYVLDVVECVPDVVEHVLDKMDVLERARNKQTHAHQGNAPSRKCIYLKLFQFLFLSVCISTSGCRRNWKIVVAMETRCCAVDLLTQNSQRMKGMKRKRQVEFRHSRPRGFKAQRLQLYLLCESETSVGPTE